MLNLNDDMDDLIRQAADEYPLKTGGSDWDEVHSGMQAATQAQPANNKKYWWLLLLLLPLVMAVPLLNNNNNKQKPTAYSNKHITADAMQQQSNNDSNNKNNKVENQVLAGKNNRLQIDNRSKKETKEPKSNNDFTVGAIATISKKNNILTGSAANNRRKKSIKHDYSNIINNALPVTNVITGDTYHNIGNNNDIPATNIIDNGALTANEIKKNTNKKENVAAADSINKNDAAKPQQDSAATVKKAPVKHTTPVKTIGLYAGANIAADVTTVKFGQVNKLGYSTAFILGYRINNNWSVESGVMWDKKSYFSKGVFFNKTKTGLSSDYNIHYLNGYCKMLEIPVNLKYDFRSKTLSGFYVTAGVSSYIMHDENYNYFVTHNSNPTQPGYFKQKDYKNASNNFFAVGNINGGYQFIFKNNNSLRVEPYLKVPLSGLGVGKLPFVSAGISAAYTLPLHLKF